MNKDNAKHYLPVIKAFAEGKTIQYHSCDGWKDLVTADFLDCWSTYRVKPEYKKFLVAMINGSIYLVHSEEGAHKCENGPGFQGWVTDWINYEVK